MVSSFFVACLALQQPKYAETKVVEATLFKNGYAVIFHEATVPADGVVWIKEPPQAVLGTLWISADADTKISEVVATKVEDKTSTVVNVDNMLEVLKLNVGKTATLTVNVGRTEFEHLTCKILAVGGQMIAVRVGEMDRVFHPSQIISLEMDKAVYTTNVESVRQIPVLKVKAKPGGKVYVMALQRGVTWSPSYLVQLGEKGKAKVIGKSTVVNDSFKLDGITVKFVSGFPNLRFLGMGDPLTAGMTVDQYVGGMMQTAGSGFGGGGGLANQAFRREAAPAGDAFAPFTPSGEGFQAEDLYFYKQPGVTLKPGDRAYYVLFQTETDFEHIYTLGLSPYIASEDYNARIATPDEEPVWHQVKFKNTAGMPLTTAPATVTQQGEIIGQDELTYTPPGADGFLKISKALDVQSETTEEEVARQGGAIKWENGRARFDKITIKGKIVVNNRKAETISLKVTKDVLGEITVASHDGQIVKTTRGLNSANVNTRCTWQRKVEKGEKLTLEYTYQIYLRSE